MNQLGLLTELGSTWHRWDLHIHAPGTRLEDGYNNDWKAFLDRLENSSPSIRALGVTDYCGISGYQQVRARKESGHLGNIDLLFPNVELRLSLQTEKQKGVNLHLLFSPDDPEHERQIERVLGKLSFSFGGTDYYCTNEDLIELGRSFDPRQLDPGGAAKVGANQFKVNLDQLIHLYRSQSWFSENCLIAVAGSKNDGTSGLQGDASFAATRRKIESFSHIIFSATPKQREFWLGKGSDSVEQLEVKYRGRKVCLHGSDAHCIDKIDSVDLDRYCWIRGDLTFDSLRQVCLEPESRAWIGSSPPSPISASYWLKSISVQNAPWLTNEKIVLNDGLVAIVGERGSGKTALLDILAQGAGALARPLSSSSFVRKALPFLGRATATIEWADGRKQSIPLAEQPSSGKSFVKYLSQQFVERLCSAEGVATELREEIERVIFEATPFEDRLAADTFDDLRSDHLDAIRRRRGDIEHEVQELGERMESEKALVHALAEKEEEKEEAKKRIEVEEKEQLKLVPEGKKERADELKILNMERVGRETELNVARKRTKTLKELEDEVRHIRQVVEPARLSQMRRDFEDASISEDDWRSFELVFSGSPDDLISKAIEQSQENERAIEFGPVTAETGNDEHPRPLEKIRRDRDVLAKLVGVDESKRRQYDQLRGSIDKLRRRCVVLEAEIKRCVEAKENCAKLKSERRSRYRAVFETFDEEKEKLERLYSPLASRLTGAAGALSKLGFFVERRVALDLWVERGIKLIDRRSAGTLSGVDGLIDAARSEMLEVWRTGDADSVATAMEDFIEKHRQDLLKGRRRNPDPRKDKEEMREWQKSVGEWLFSTDHLTLVYGINYEGTPIERLSPGTRGIVLLLLYLAIDEKDRRPLLVDQPEENLDPRSVFRDLVGHFREARLRRQVIIVTHNPNLVVNADADQVLVATSTRGTGSGLPTISYQGGALENLSTRAAVCNILEGGQRAFQEREKRYRLARERPVGSS